MTDPETFYQQTYHNLLILKKREARYRRPDRVPPALLEQIENYEKAIFLTRQRLDSLISEANWRKAIKQLVLADIPPEPPIIDTDGTTQTANESASLPPVEYNLGNIRKLLTRGFSDTELRSFCFDQPEFQEVYDQLAEQTGKEEIISLIIEHADQHLLFEPLLAWAKINNPSRYHQHQPYTIDSLQSG